MTITFDTFDDDLYLSFCDSLDEDSKIHPVISASSAKVQDLRSGFQIRSKQSIVALQGNAISSILVASRAPSITDMWRGPGTPRLHARSADYAWLGWFRTCLARLRRHLVTIRRESLAKRRKAPAPCGIRMAAATSHARLLGVRCSCVRRPWVSKGCQGHDQCHRTSSGEPVREPCHWFQSQIMPTIRHIHSPAYHLKFSDAAMICAV